MTLTWWMRSGPIEAIVFLGLAFGAEPSRSEVLVPAPSFSHRAGYYSFPLNLAIESILDESNIRYTTDGSIPEEDSLLYTAPLEVTQTTVIRARVFGADNVHGPVATATYLMEETGGPPTLSLVTAPENLWDASTGIYANPLERGDQWERPAHVEFIEDGSLSWSAECGIRIHGNFGRTFSKKSFRLYFSSDYGEDSLAAQLFEDQEVDAFKRLVLSAGGNDSSVDPRPDWSEGWSLIRDAVMSRLFQDSGTVATDSRPIRLLLNGEPWGIYFLKERIDRFFIEDRFSYRDFDLLQRDTELFVEEGTNEEWTRLEGFFESSDLSDPVAFASAEAWMDLDNFNDHYAIEMWAGNYDWPQNNFFHLRPNVPTGRFQWIPWDTDASLAAPTTADATRSIYPHVTGMHVNGLDWSTLWFRRLLESETFKTRFINRIADLLNTTLKSSHALRVVEEVAAAVRPGIQFETDRWGSSPDVWENHVQRIAAFARDREAHFLEHTREYFNLSGTFVLTLENPEGMGAVRVNRNLFDAFPWTGRYFQNVPLPIAALPAPGYRFVRWEGTASLPNSSSATLTADSDRTIRAVFEPIPHRPRPNDVLVNEYWNNDNGTPYVSLGGKPIWGDWVELLVADPRGVDLRNWRLTNNETKVTRESPDPDTGSLLFPPFPELAALPLGTIVLIIADDEGDNAAHFQFDDIDLSDGNLTFYVGAKNLDAESDRGFNLRAENDSLALLAPGSASDFLDDVGVDFIAEGTEVTPYSFGIAEDGVVFENPFEGIGGDDGATLVGLTSGVLNNDDGSEAPDPGEPGPGGWIVDPPLESSGDGLVGTEGNLLTPGRRNPGQAISNLILYDLDRSGGIDSRDLLVWLRERRKEVGPLIGDFNDDGRTNSGDLFDVSARFYSSLSK